MTTETQDEGPIIRRYTEALLSDTPEAAQTRQWCAEKLRGHHGPLDLRLDPQRVQFIREHIAKLPAATREELKKRQRDAEAEEAEAAADLERAQRRHEEAQNAAKVARNTITEADKEVRQLREFIQKYPFAGLAVRSELEVAGIDTSPIDRIAPKD